MSQPLIRRLDQAVLAILAAAALACASIWWLASGGVSGGLVEIDNAPPLDYQFLVDLNQAEWPELAQLPGIGETLARRIVESRSTDGEFRTIDTLQRVDGIGPRKLESMRRYLLPTIDDSQVAGDKSIEPNQG